MSLRDRQHGPFTLTTAATASTPEFGVCGGVQLSIETDVVATGSPTGAWTLQKYDSEGWVTYDLGDASFTDPAAGAAAGSVNLQNPPPGKYRVTYTRSSGGAASGASVRVKVNGYGGGA